MRLLRGVVPGKKRRVALIGNVSQEPYCNNLLPIAAAFERAAEVRIIEPWQVPEFVPTWGAKPAPVPLPAFSSLGEEFVPEIVVCLAGGLYLDSEVRGAFPQETVTVGLALSDPLGIEASLGIAERFDLFYSQDPHALPIYLERGLDVGLCKPAADPAIYRPMRGGAACDVIFVGKWTAHRDRLVQALAEHCSIRVHTRRDESRWSIPVHPPLNRPADLARAYSGARLALEVALVEQPDNPLHGSYRITNRPQFAAACRIPSLIEPYDELARFFEPGREIAVYNDGDELADRALELLRDDRRRRAMGRRARRRVAADHTWDQRIRRILSDAERLLPGT